MEFTFEGRAVPFQAGQSITAALVRAGEPESGVFCAIGVCFGCVVRVDGQLLRGCVTAAGEGHVVHRAS